MNGAGTRSVLSISAPAAITIAVITIEAAGGRSTAAARMCASETPAAAAVVGKPLNQFGASPGLVFEWTLKRASRQPAARTYAAAASQPATPSRFKSLQ